MAILDVKDLTIKFGGLTAVDNFEVKIEKNELVGLIGPNGAGKTTIFNLLTGVYKPTIGSIYLNDKKVAKATPLDERVYDGNSKFDKFAFNIKQKIRNAKTSYANNRGLKPSDIVQLGSSRTFQNIRLFKNMSVIDNIKVAYHNRMSYGLMGSVIMSPKYLKQEKEADKIAMDLLNIFELGSYSDELAKNLPYGKQRKLEIARALATNPTILLLDEPAAGMNPQETEELMTTIKFIKNTFNVSVLLIEHDMKLVMGICERIVVIDYGKIIAKGTPEEIRTNPDVIRAYLGE